MAAAQPVPCVLPDQAEFEQMLLTEIGERFKNDRMVPAVSAPRKRHDLPQLQSSVGTAEERCYRQAHLAMLVQPLLQTSQQQKREFFESSKLELRKVIGLSYKWASSVGSARGMSQVNLMRELRVSEHTVVDWRQFMRYVAVTYFLNNPEQIGGPCVVVEIDESLFRWRKNHVGQLREEMWVLGGYEQARRRGFLVWVDRRDVATLLPIIQQWVAPGSIIWTDMWAAYKYNQLPNMAYQHDTVNHTLRFVDPITGVTTNRV